MPDESAQQVLDAITKWLQKLASDMRAGRANNERFAEPYSLAADALKKGSPQQAIDILKYHRSNANSEENSKKYKDWLIYLAQLRNQ